MTTFNSVPNIEQREKVKQLWEKEKELLEYIEECCSDGREKSLAITKLEECVMWVLKSISLENVKGA